MIIFTPRLQYDITYFSFSKSRFIQMIQLNERLLSTAAAAASAGVGVRQKICLNLSLKTMIFCSSQSPLLLLR